MNVLLAGATGETGQELIRSLHGAGHDVFALVRAESVEKLTPLLPMLRKVLPADVTDPGSVAGICAGIDAVITLVTRTRARERHLQVDVAGNTNLLREAERAGVRRFIFVSSLGAGSVPDVPVLAAKGLFEEELRRSALNWLIVRPSALFQDMDRILSMARGQAVFLFGSGKQRVTPMGEHDLAEFITARLQGPSGTLEIGGPETLTMDDIARLARRSLGKPESVIHLPLWLFSCVVTLVRIMSPDSYPVMRFVQYVFGNSNEAANAGHSTLADHFRQRASSVQETGSLTGAGRLFRR